MDKVFVNDKPLYFTDNIESELIKKTIEFEGESSVAKAIRILEEGFLEELYLFSNNLHELKKLFIAQFHYLEAAGGVVKNIKGDYLFILRHGKWDLPKGKIEVGEETETAALREIEEETGIKDGKILRELPSTFHTYKQDGKRMLKRTYWFEILAENPEELIPQTEEHITEVQWMNKFKVLKAMGNTYNSIKDVVRSLD